MSTSRKKQRPAEANSCDAIARDAARRLVQGEARDLAEARRRASEAADAPGSRARAPSAKRIREHAQALDLQAMGEAAYHARVRGWLVLTEDLMATLAQAGMESVLVGRAAEQRFDGDPSIHIRVLAPTKGGGEGGSVTEIAQRLADLGYEAADAVFPTLEVKSSGRGGSAAGGEAVGRLSQMQWLEGGARITLTRCTQRLMFQSRHNLVTGEPAAMLTLTQLQQALEGSSPVEEPDAPRDAIGQ